MIQLDEFIYDLVNIATGSVKAISYGAKTLHDIARKVPDDKISSAVNYIELLRQHQMNVVDYKKHWMNLIGLLVQE